MKKSFHRLLFKEGGKRATWEYPFAVAGINVTFMLIQMLDLYSGGYRLSFIMCFCHKDYHRFTFWDNVRVGALSISYYRVFQ